MFSYSAKGSFKNTEDFLKKMSNQDVFAELSTCGSIGVEALSSATPTDTGLAANSWDYRIKKTSKGYELEWTSSDIEDGFPVARMIQIGYGTGTGGYVRGRDYINPAMRPVFDQITERVWKAVTSA